MKKLMMAVASCAVVTPAQHPTSITDERAPNTKEMPNV